MRLLDRVRHRMNETGYSRSTINIYVGWLVKFITYHKLQHPQRLTVVDVDKFITHMAVDRDYSAISQNQALDAIRYLYREIIQQDIDRDLAGLRARVPKRQPETASPEIIQQIISLMAPKYRLMAYLIYGAGLSVSECVRLKIYQVDFSRNSITVGKRETVLPQLIRDDLGQQIIVARHWPGNVDEYIFPSSRLHNGRCYYVSPSSFQKAIKQATEQAGVHQRITSRVLKHSFALHLLQSGYDIRTVQEIVGHDDIRSTMVYQRMVDIQEIRSPLDDLE